jgi:RimJ/RimL family protein N-acetyltransferase
LAMDRKAFRKSSKQFWSRALSRSRKLSLNKLNREEMWQLFRWRNDPCIYKWCRQCEPLSRSDHERWFDWQSKDAHTRMYGAFEEGQLIGVCGLTSIDWINRRAEFSLYIGPEHQKRGLGQKALQVLVGHGFNVLNLNCIWGEAFDGNPAIEMFSRVGFKEEGRRRAFYFREGRYLDAMLFSILKDEYAARDSDYCNRECDFNGADTPADPESGDTRAQLNYIRSIESILTADACCEKGAIPETNR